MKSSPSKRAVHGSIKDVVVFAQVNNMSAPAVARHFKVCRNSIYHAARRMGVRLASVQRGPKKDVAV